MTKRAPFEQTRATPGTGGSVIEVETLTGNLRFQISGNHKHDSVGTPGQREDDPRALNC